MTDTEIEPARHPGVGSAALALWAQAEGRRLARELTSAGIPVLMLKGPELQARLYGTPAAYQSGDVDVLVPRGHAGRARQLLVANGWRFARENGVLWRLNNQAAYERDGFWLDLHWGLQVADLPGRTLRSVERALWKGAQPGPSGMLEPDPESLLVFLAAHVVGHRFERPQWQENVVACAGLVEDWPKVWRIARLARVETAVHKALEGGPPGQDMPVIDGLRGRLLWAATWVARGRFLPEGLRSAVVEAFALRREGFGLVGWTRVRARPHAGHTFLVPRGVFPPQKTPTLVRLGLDAIVGVPSPIVVEVGTGSGAVALSIGTRRGDAKIHATDISPRALTAAKVNRRRRGVRNVRFYRGSLLEPLPHSLRARTAVVIANIPFVPPKDAPDLRYLAPRAAIQGPSADGLALVRDLARQATEFLRSGGRLICQIAEFQWTSLAESLVALGYRLHEPELGVPTFAIAEWTGDAVD